MDWNQLLGLIVFVWVALFFYAALIVSDRYPEGQIKPNAFQLFLWRLTGSPTSFMLLNFAICLVALFIFGTSLFRIAPAISGGIFSALLVLTIVYFPKKK